MNGTGKKSALLKCPNPRFPFLYLASWSWTFWHWDISHVIWCELQSVTSSQIKPPWPPYCRYCFFYRNSTCEMFWKKIEKKKKFCHPPQKGFFSRFLQSSSLKLTSSWFPSLYLMLWMYQGLRFFVCISRVSSVVFLLPSLTSWVPEIFTRKCYQRCFLCQQSLSHYFISFQRSPCQVHVPFNNYSTRARWIWDDR